MIGQTAETGGWAATAIRSSCVDPPKVPASPPSHATANAGHFLAGTALKSHGSEIVFTSRLGEITQRLFIMTGGLYILSFHITI